MCLDEIAPGLPEQVSKWVDNSVLGYSRYLFTHRVGGVRYGYCTYCNQTSALTLERTYSEQDVINNGHKHREEGYCPACGSRVQFRDTGRGRKKLCDKEYIVFATPLKDGGVLVRAGLVFRDYVASFENVQTVFSEDYRIYYNTGVDVSWRSEYRYGRYGVEKFFLRQSIIPCPSSGQPWYTSDTNYAYNSYYGFTDKRFKKTNLKYAPISEYMKKGTDPCGFLDTYIKYPMLTEKLVKEGFVELAENKAEINRIVNRRAKSVSVALGLDKAELRQARGEEPNEIYRMQFAKKHGIPFENAKRYSMYDLTDDRVAQVEKYLPFKKADAYLTKQHESLGTLLDYWNDCKKLKFDLKREDILLPSDLRQAHQRTIEAVIAERKRKQEEENRKAEEKAAEMIKRYQKAYSFDDGIFAIRPAETIAELINEGSALHHCVATYADRYFKGETVILFIRRKDDTDTPFYTLEYSEKTGSIVQCRGLRNCGKTPEVERFVEEWQEFLKKKKNCAVA